MNPVELRKYSWEYWEELINLYLRVRDVYSQSLEDGNQQTQEDGTVPVPVEHREGLLHVIDLLVGELVRQAGHAVHHWGLVRREFNFM